MENTQTINKEIKIVKVNIPADFQTTVQKNIDHIDYFMLENDIEIPKQVLDYVVSTLSPTWTALPLIYQLATKAETIVELGVGWGKPTETILWGLRDGNKNGRLYSIDLGNKHVEDSMFRILKQQDIKNLWTLILEDFFKIPDDYLATIKADFVFSDIDIHSSPPEVYKEIFPDQPDLDINVKDRSHYAMINKLLPILKDDGLIIIHNYERTNDNINRLVEEGKVEIIFRDESNIHFLDFWVLRKKK